MKFILFSLIFLSSIFAQDFELDCESSVGSKVAYDACIALSTKLEPFVKDADKCNSKCTDDKCKTDCELKFISDMTGGQDPIKVSSCIQKCQKDDFLCQNTCMGGLVPESITNIVTECVEKCGKDEEECLEKCASDKGLVGDSNNSTSTKQNNTQSISKQNSTKADINKTQTSLNSSDKNGAINNSTENNVTSGNSSDKKAPNKDNTTSSSSSIGFVTKITGSLNLALSLMSLFIIGML